MFPQWLRSAVNFIAYYLGRGESLDASQRRLSAKYPDISQQQVQMASVAAEEGFERARAANMAGPDFALSSLYQGTIDVESTVTVRVRVELTGPSGATSHKTFVKEYGWDSDLRTVRNDASEWGKGLIAASGSDLGAGWSVGDTEIIPPLLFGRE